MKGVQRPVHILVLLLGPLGVLSAETTPAITDNPFANFDLAKMFGLDLDIINDVIKDRQATYNDLLQGNTQSLSTQQQRQNGDVDAILKQMTKIILNSNLDPLNFELVVMDVTLKMHTEGLSNISRMANVELTKTGQNIHHLTMPLLFREIATTVQVNQKVLGFKISGNFTITITKLAPFLKLRLDFEKNSISMDDFKILHVGKVVTDMSHFQMPFFFGQNVIGQYANQHKDKMAVLAESSLRRTADSVFKQYGLPICQYFKTMSMFNQNTTAH